MNDANAKPNTNLVWIDPAIEEEARRAEEEARSELFAKFMQRARDLKKIKLHVDTAIIALLSEFAALNPSDLQAKLLIIEINKATKVGIKQLERLWKPILAKAEEARAAAGAAGYAGSGSGAGSAGWGPAGASSNATYAGAFGQYCLDEYGLFWRNNKKVWVKIAGPFEILGLARDEDKDHWGKLLRFKNSDELVCEEVVTEETLRTDPHSVAARLVGRGMWISGISAEERAFLEYLMLEFAIAERVTRTRSTGWIKIGAERAFVLPDEIIGASGTERIILDQRSYASYAQRGTLDEWREAIAKPAGDHLMMRLSISTSLAGPLLYLGAFESGILNFWGGSAQGKTTLLRIAASSWGSGADNGYIRVWRTTANAMEASLQLANDTLFVLDELGQADGRELGAMVYMVAGSQGKARMRADASLKVAYKWRVLVLSSGEAPIAARIGEGQKVKRAHAGQLVRAIDIPEGRALGMFDQVYPDFDAKAFADEMKVAASTYYGVAGPQFVRELIERRVTGGRVRELVAEFVAKALKGIDKGAHGQAARVAERFGLIAAAAKLATEFAIVWWPDGQVDKDALELFQDWLIARGGAAPAEVAQMISQVRAFVEAHGDARFDDLDPPPTSDLGRVTERRPVSNRAGFRRGEGAARRWLVLPEAWRSEICVGFDSSKVAKTLAAHGMLESDSEGKTSRPETIEGKKMRVYVLKPSIFEGWDE